MTLVEMTVYGQSQLPTGELKPVGVIAFNLDHIIKIQLHIGMYYKVTLSNGDSYYIGSDSYFFLLEKSN